MAEVKTGRPARRPRLGLVLEAFADRPLAEVLDWVVREVPEVTSLEVGAGGYAPRHCNTAQLLADPEACRAWRSLFADRGLAVGALNVWGNPLHPDPEVARRHAAALRDAIRFAAEVETDTVVAMAGCPAATPGDRTPHFAAGGWLPYLESIHERQWADSVMPYWQDVAEFARREHPGLSVCLELHPGTVAYNVESFEQLAAAGPAIAVNLDPSHLFWMQMDALAVVRRLRDRIRHVHAKDVAFSPEHLALNGLLDRRWPRPAAEMPWNFAVVGHGRDESWWGEFLGEVSANCSVATVAIEHEDPFVPAEAGIKEAAGLLDRAFAATAGERAG